MGKGVIITGLGVVSSIGIGKEEFWDSLIKGKSGITKISSFDTSDFPTHPGGEIKDFRPEVFINKRKLKALGRTSCLAIASAKLALIDSQLKLDNLDKEKIGVIIGTTMGESQILEIINKSWVKIGESAIDQRLIPRYPANVLSARPKFFNSQCLCSRKLCYWICL